MKATGILQKPEANEQWNLNGVHLVHVFLCTMEVFLAICMLFQVTLLTNFCTSNINTSLTYTGVHCYSITSPEQQVPKKLHFIPSYPTSH